MLKFWHTGILTPDIKKTLDTLCALPGVQRDKWSITEMEFPPEDMLTGAGGKLKIAVGRVGGVVYELIEPLDTSSYHAKVLEQRGPGAHHAAYACGDALDAIITQALAAGARIVWEARHGAEHVVYLESADGGTVWEFIDNCPPVPEE